MKVLRSEKHAQSIGFTMKPVLLQVLETNEKSKPKKSSKVVFLGSFSVVGPSLVDLFIVFEDFGSRGGPRSARVVLMGVSGSPGVPSGGIRGGRPPRIIDKIMYQKHVYTRL